MYVKYVAIFFLKKPRSLSLFMWLCLKKYIVRTTEDTNFHRYFTAFCKNQIYITVKINFMHYKASGYSKIDWKLYRYS
jgi:hypothetical protein